jgi:hypothetical protein
LPVFTCFSPVFYLFLAVFLGTSGSWAPAAPVCLTSALATAPRTPLAPGFAEILIAIIIIEMRATGFAEIIIIIIRVAMGFAEVVIMIMRGRGWWC